MGIEPKPFAQAAKSYTCKNVKIFIILIPNANVNMIMMWPTINEVSDCLRKKN